MEPVLDHLMVQGRVSDFLNTKLASQYLVTATGMVIGAIGNAYWYIVD